MDLNSNTASTDASSGRSKAVRMNPGFSLTPNNRDIDDSEFASPHSANNIVDTLCRGITHEEITFRSGKTSLAGTGPFDAMTPSSSAKTRSRRRYPELSSTMKPELNDWPRHLRQASPGKRQ